MCNESVHSQDLLSVLVCGLRMWQRPLAFVLACFCLKNEFGGLLKGKKRTLHCPLIDLARLLHHRHSLSSVSSVLQRGPLTVPTHWLSCM